MAKLVLDEGLPLRRLGLTWPINTARHASQ
jgi:hypothetical protein